MKRQTLAQLWALIQSDMYRYEGRYGLAYLPRIYIKQKGFVATFYYRITRFCFLNHYKLPYIFFKLFKRGMEEHFMYEIPQTCKIGPGLCVRHLGGMILNDKGIVGKNASFSHQMTIGEKPGVNGGVPVLLDNVYVAPGAKIIGGITIGNNVAIGANAVVTKDAPDNAVMLGIPAKCLNLAGSGEYCLHVDYENKIPNLPGPESY